MKLLVTGHRGYIGTILVPRLQAAGHHVVGADIDLYRGCDFTPTHADTAPWLGPNDIRDITPEHLTDVDAVIHLAGLSNDPLGNIDPDLTDAINHRATRDLAKAAKAAGVSRFLFSSSCSNYGASGSDDWLNEEARLRPVTPYARSKVDSEAALVKLADETFSPVFLRSATAYGVSPRLRFDLVLNNLVAWAMATGQIRLKSDGSAWRPLVHIVDIAQAFEKALAAPKEAVHAQAFNVGHNADCMRVRDLAENIRAALPETEITFASGAATDTRTYRVDCSKIANIGFTPYWSVEEGIAELRNALLKHPVTPEDFEGPQFARVARLRMCMDTGERAEDLRRTGAPVA